MTAYIISHLNQIKHGFGIKIFFVRKIKICMHTGKLKTFFVTYACKRDVCIRFFVEGKSDKIKS